MPDLATIRAPVSSLRSDELSGRALKIMETTADVMAMTDASGGIIYLNPRGRRLLGLLPDGSIEELTLSDLQPAWAVEVIMQEAIPASLASGSWSGETALLSGNGTELPVLQLLLAHKGEDGEVEFFSTTCRDITDRKQNDLEKIEWANRYDAAIQASGQVFFDWDTDTDTIHYRGDTEGLIGISPDGLGTRLADLRAIVRSQDRSQFDAAFENALTARDRFHHEFSALRPDSTEVLIEAQGCFFLDREGRLSRMIGFLRDVTKQQEATRITQLANETLEQRVNDRMVELRQANDHLECSANRQSVIARLGMNALAGEQLDKLMNEAVNAIRKMLPADCSSLLELNEEEEVFHCRADSGWPASNASLSIPVSENSECTHTIQVGVPVIVPDIEQETRFRPSESVRSAGLRSGLSVCIKTGESNFGVLTAFSMTRQNYSSDDVNFVQAIANVVTTAIERRHAEEKVRHAQTEAEAANRAKTEFLSRMSHELRTPLNAVLGFTQLLEMEEHTERQRESITHISRAGRNLLELINEILDIARLDAGRVTFNVETIDVMELIRQSAETFKSAAARRGIEIRIAENSGDEPFVLADRERLKQILSNLLSNSIKFNRDGGSVTLAVAQVDFAKSRISITDTGTGIPQEKISRLFVPFERLGTREGGTEGGTGLGLALCQRLARAMDGHIGVASSPGLGSTFWLELPAARMTPAPGNLEAPPESRAVVRHILYVEDDSTTFYLLDRILVSRPGIKMLSALRGEQGLQMARDLKPELILLDMNLPDMTGEQFLRRLKDDPAAASIPVIPVTGDALGDRRIELAKLGVKEVIQKPYSVAEITGMIDRMCPRAT